MKTPFDVEFCKKTGRLLTEWFEHPEEDLDDLKERGAREYGLEEYPKKPYSELNEEEKFTHRRINGFIAQRANGRWPYNKTQQEVQWRLNEATKFVSPDNQKALPEDIQERTGLEMNPLWFMETLVRSGLLSPKDQVSALKTLAEYTHSKAPSIRHSTNTELTAEDWLVELAKEEYQVIDDKIDMAKPLPKADPGAARRNDRIKRTEAVYSLEDYKQSAMEKMKAEFDEAETLDDDEEE